MRLIRAQIRNFRSISDVTISFEPRCRVLVGINESGKSNILRALALLDESRKPTPEDLRDFLPDEDPDQEAFVRFVFALAKTERISAYEAAAKKTLAPGVSEPVVTAGGKNLTLAQFFDTRTEVLYSIDIRDGARTLAGWRLPDTFHSVGPWFKPSPQCPPNYQCTLPDGRTVQLRSYALIHGDLAAGVQENFLTPAAPEDINGLAIAQITEIAKGKLPSCLFWTYSDSHLLPAQIPLDQFASSPEICEPLRHMFALADIDDIRKAVAEANSRPNGIRNLLNRVARNVSMILRHLVSEFSIAPHRSVPLASAC